MDNLSEQLLETIGIIEKYMNERSYEFLNQENIIRLNNVLQEYTNQRFSDSDYLFSELQKKEWIEMLSDCVKAISNRDKVFLIDILQNIKSSFVETIKI